MQNGNGKLDHAQEVALRLLSQEIHVGYWRMGIDARKSSVDRLEKNFVGALERVAPQATSEGEQALAELRTCLDKVSAAYFPIFAASAVNGEISRNLALAILRDPKEQNFWAPRIDDYTALVAVSGVKFDGSFSPENALAYLRNLKTEQLTTLQKTNSVNLAGACQFANIELFALVRERMNGATGKLNQLATSPNPA